ncbi:MAG: hypothetical protein P8Y80_02185 [Acidobacteriota bacterium]
MSHRVCFKLCRFHNGFWYLFILVQQIARINDNETIAVIFSVFIQIERFLVQPAELFTSFRSTTRLEVSLDITAIGNGNFRAVGSM